MDVTVENLTAAEDIFLILGRIELKAGESKVIPDVTVADLDGDAQLKGLIVDGKVSVTVADDLEDAAGAATGSLSPHALPRYTVATLPTGYEGRMAFATNGRKTAEGPGSGTGVPVYFSNGNWRVFFDDSVVAS